MSTVTDLNKEKEANLYSKLLICGYVRELQHKYSLCNIPIIVSYLCLLHFYDKQDYFDKLGDGVKISSNNKITRIRANTFFYAKNWESRDWKNTTYCKNWINSMSKQIIKWTFTLNNKCDICIGITSIDDEYDDDFSESHRSIYYSIAENGWRYDYAQFHRNGHLERYPKSIQDVEFKENDIISFILNLNTSQIFLQKNMDQNILLFANIKTDKQIKYKFAVSLGKKGDSVTLNNYQSICV